MCCIDMHIMIEVRIFLQRILFIIIVSKLSHASFSLYHITIQYYYCVIL